MEHFVEIGDPDELREILGPVTGPAKSKVRAVLDAIDVEWIAASPVCLIATSDRNAGCDVSPKGDPPGFSRVIDGSTLFVPDRPGNRRADGLHNILENGWVGLIYFIPGRGDTMRSNGRARVLKDCPEFDAMTVGGAPAKSGAAGGRRGGFLSLFQSLPAIETVGSRVVAAGACAVESGDFQGAGVEGPEAG